PAKPASLSTSSRSLRAPNTACTASTTGSAVAASPATSPRSPSPANSPASSGPPPPRHDLGRSITAATLGTPATANRRRHARWSYGQPSPAPPVPRPAHAGDAASALG